jgi:hypothetical protein
MRQLRGTGRPLYGDKRGATVSLSSRARTLEEQKQGLDFLNHSLAVGGQYMEEAMILEVFTDVYYYNEPFTSLFHDYISPAAWTLFLTHQELERQRKRFLVAEEGHSRPYKE